MERCVTRKTGNGDHGGYARFDLQVRELCYELKEGVYHVIFDALGVVDLIVEYARPLLPLFAKIPNVLMSAMNDHKARATNYEPHGSNFDSAWRYQSPRWQCGNDISIGSVFSCPEIGRSPECMVDCIVVVPPTQVAGNKYYLQKEWIVGVIVPVVLPPAIPKNTSHFAAQMLRAVIDLNDDGKLQRGFTFGADRTIFDDQLCKMPGLWQPETPPKDGYYVVHYVDVHCCVKSYWDPVLSQFIVMRPNGQIRPVYQPNPINVLFSHHQLSTLVTHKIHLLPLEIPYYQAETHHILK